MAIIDYIKNIFTGKDEVVEIEEDPLVPVPEGITITKEQYERMVKVVKRNKETSVYDSKCNCYRGA